MASFQAWNESVKEGVLATQDSFATTHPVFTVIVMVSIFVVFCYIAYKLNSQKGGVE